MTGCCASGTIAPRGGGAEQRRAPLPATHASPLPATHASPLPAALAALCLAGCAPLTLTADAPLAVEGREIAPFAFHEECGDITAGDRIDFRFTATRPVHFEIYYKDGIARIAPVVRDDVTEASGIFPPPASRRYCVRWDVGREGAIVDYWIRVLGPSRR